MFRLVSVEKALYLVQAHLVEGRSVGSLARDHGVDPSTLYRWLRRYRSGGAEALRSRSRRPRSSPLQTPVETEEAIVLLRKELSDSGVDAGAETIHYHLSRDLDVVPSVSTIWRILKRRGFVSPQPKKRPRSSFRSFAADLPNQMWQADMTHWELAGGAKVEIVTFIDDCSRVVTGCYAVVVATAINTAEAFHKAAVKWGYPASLLTDNGCIFTAKHRNGKVRLESDLEALGIVFKHGRPYHPQTQGKVERVQQTLKSKWLLHRPRVRTLPELQHQLNEFCDHYNDVRPHKAIGKVPPKSVFDSMVKAGPGDALPSTQFRVMHTKVHANGKLTIRHNSKLQHFGVGRAHKGKAVTMFVSSRLVRIVDTDTAELLGVYEIDPDKTYQRKRPPEPG